MMLSPLALLTQLALVSVASARPFSRRAASVAALNDPFYLPPAGFEAAQPGTILASRQIQATYNGRPLNATAYQLLYRTTSANTTTPISTVTTVFQPAGHRQGQAVFYAEAEDSDASSCAPSQSYKSGLSVQNDEDIIVVGLLDQGWTVASPDHEGPDSAFSPGRLEGHAVLDGMRAVLNFAPLGFSNQTRVAGYGYSGGALATGWASVLQPTYAPELHVVGWSYGGTPANLSQVLQYLDGTLFSGYGFGGVGGLSNAYTSIYQLVQNIATAQGQAALNYIYNNCGNSDVVEFAFKKFQSTTYQSEGDRVLYDPTVQSVLEENVMGLYANETPTAPVYLVHAEHDEIIPVAGATDLYDRYCSHGIKSLLYEIDTGPAEHVSGAILFFPNVVNFLNDRFAGVPPVSGCVQKSSVLPVLDPAAAPSALKIIYEQLLTILTGQIGVDDSIYKSKLTTAAAAIGNVPGLGGVP